MEIPYNITDIFDTAKLKTLFESLADLNGYTLGIKDLEGNIIIKSGFTRLCNDFHRSKAESLAGCEYDVINSIELSGNNQYTINTCKNGLTVVTIPVTIENFHICDLFTGQLFLQPPDLDFFRDSAKRLNFEEKTYLEAVKKIPVVAEEQLKKRITFLIQLTQMITDLGYRNLQTKDYLNQLEKSNVEAEIVNERFEYATSVGKTGTWDWNLESDELIWSAETYRIIGFESYSFKPSYNQFLEFVHPDDRQMLDSKVKEAWENKKPYSVDCRIVKKESDIEIFCNATGKVEYDVNGKPIRMIGTFRDISERKQADEKKALLADMLETAPNSVVIHDKSGKFLYANQKACEQHGYTPEEFMKLDLSKLDATESAHLMDERIHLIQEQGYGSFEVTHITKDGTKIPFEIYAKCVSWEGKPAILSIGMDISERKKLINELTTAKEKAEEANRMKTEFLNNMSHEVRTPMNGIIGFAEMLTEPGLPDDRKEYYSRIIHSSSENLLKTINDILEISTLETKQETIYETDFSLNSLLTDIFIEFSVKLNERNIPLHLKKPLADEQSNIITDQVKLKKIMRILLENASKFTSEGFIEFGYQIENQNMVLYVKDTGLGISSEKHGVIFDRFSQEHKNMSQLHGGLGLGLAIAKENTLLLGGSIELESETGKGSTFYISLPYKPVKTSARTGIKEGAVNPVPRDAFTILIAEDEAINFLYLESLLKKNPEPLFTVLHAHNGKVAVEMCRNNKHIDLVFMDIKMPVMDGYKASELIHRDFPNLPIIAQTAYSTQSDKEKALYHGCIDFLTKPIHKEKLFHKIHKYLCVTV